jgi:hypothetical protein
MRSRWEAQPSNTTALPNPLFLESRSSKGNRRPGSLQDAFTSAVPAELPTEPHLILENKYPALRSLRTDTEIGDGLWVCCHCHHENILRHWKGPFPFKYLRCNRCERQPCTSCHSSEILTPWPRGMITAHRPAYGHDVRYCHVCTNCGLSHRADLEGRHDTGLLRSDLRRLWDVVLRGLAEILYRQRRAVPERP